MQIRLKKGRDGPDSLACVREDGSSTWRRIQRGLAIHDLAHLAVESELGVGDGFFGLVEGGWSFEAFADAEERARIPPAAIWVEFLVNAFLTEAMSGECLDDEAFHAGIVQSSAKIGVPVPRKLEAGEIARVRASIVAFAARWRALEPGDTLELAFVAPQRSSFDSIRRSGTSHESATTA
jgi:hypothetical protein